MLNRYYANKIPNYLKPNKVLVIYGPRRVGKTTLVESFLDSLNPEISIYRGNGENMQLRQVLESSDFSQIIPYFSSYHLVFIDEAQKINQVGSGLKIIVDQIPGIKVIVTGSSSFDLSNKIGEPLVGRQSVFKLYPLSVLELEGQFGRAFIEEQRNNLLIYGGYPEIINSKSTNERVDYLQQIRDSYLYKDILELENLKNSKKINDLLRLIAFQIGQEVSLHELGTQLGMSKNTVERYLDLLEKAFVVINIRGFSKNLRKEVTKTSRYYFIDNGIRNSIIGNFNSVNNRTDLGQLWENFLVIERLKKQAYTPIYSNNYFWRTWDKKEVDWVEMRDGKLFGFELKWQDTKSKHQRAWLNAYPEEAEFQLVNRDNYLDFIT